MQPIDTGNPTILLAIELSASTWLVAARVPRLEKPHLHRIDGSMIRKPTLPYSFWRP
jgi:hypothetical protein